MQDLRELQIDREAIMGQKGLDRLNKMVETAKAKGQEQNTCYGAALVKQNITQIAVLIDAWKLEAGSGKPGRKQVAYKYIGDTDSHVLAYMALTFTISKLSSEVAYSKLCMDVGAAVEDEVRAAVMAKGMEKRDREIFARGVGKRTNTRNRKAYLKTVAHSRGIAKWDRKVISLVGGRLVEFLLESGLIVREEIALDKLKTQNIIKATPEILEWIEKTVDIVGKFRPIYRPMITPPRSWSNPTNGGYLSNGVKPIKLLKTRNKAYLSDLHAVEMPKVYQAINTIQATPWTINREVLEVMKTFWDRGEAIGKIPSQYGTAIPPSPKDKTDTTTPAWREWKRIATEIHKQNRSRSSKRMQAQFCLSEAKDLAQFEAIWFPYNMDFRGRVYAVPQFNPQGADWMKGLLTFANRKPLGSDGATWLAIHGANCAGYDKATLEDRVKWIEDNEEVILNCAEDPLTHKYWTQEIAGVEIDKPWQFLAFCMEWFDMRKYEHENGTNETFESCLPVAVDGSCSGLQHFSAILRDEIGGAAVNLTPSEIPQDVYKLVADKVIESVKEDLISGTEDAPFNDMIKDGTKSMARQWLGFGITRKTTKRSVMTLAYGSKKFGFKDQIMEDTITPAKLGAIGQDGLLDLEKFPFTGDGYLAAIYMANKIWAAVTETLVKSVEAMDWLQDCARVIGKAGQPVRWMTPIGLPVESCSMKQKTQRIELQVHGGVVKLFPAYDTETIDTKKQSQAVSPNYIHSMDASHLMMTTIAGLEVGIEDYAYVHDSFGCHAGYMGEFFNIIRAEMVNMYESQDVFKEFLEANKRALKEGDGELPSPPKTSSLDLSQLTQSWYCFA